MAFSVSSRRTGWAIAVVSAAVSLGWSRGAWGLVESEGETLTIGSMAPAVEVRRWVKGEPVERLEEGKIYVVEFWAPSCGPCVVSVPHVTEVARANPDVVVMGICVFEKDGPAVTRFVEKMGEKMEYRVGYSGNTDGMAASWMRAAGQNGIPAAFIVKDRRIAWVGHPMEMDKPLAEIKAGTFDVAGFKANFEERANRNRKEMAIQGEVEAATALFEKGERAEARAALAEVVRKNPRLADTQERIHFRWLAVEDPAAWEVKARVMRESGSDAELMKLANFALTVAEKEGLRGAARKAMEMALEKNPGDLVMLQYARAFYERTGEAAARLDVAKRLLRVVEEKGGGAGGGMEELKATLREEIGELEGRGR